MAASATFALKAGVWFRRGRLLMVSPDSRSTACPPSGRNSTYRPVQIFGTGSTLLTRRKRRRKTSIGWRRWSNEYVYGVLGLYWDWKIHPLPSATAYA